MSLGHKFDEVYEKNVRNKRNKDQKNMDRQVCRGNMMETNVHSGRIQSFVTNNTTRTIHTCNHRLQLYCSSNGGDGVRLLS